MTAAARPTPTVAPTVLAIVLAGGQGSRLESLTAERAKPTLPFGGVHSLLDIALSNATNSGITDVWVVVQYHASSFDAVLAHGRPWDLDRFSGGLRVIPPQEGLGPGESDDGGMATGNADALYRIRRLIARHDPDHVLVLSADHVYRLDHREVLAEHVARDADCTVVTTTIRRSEAGHHTLVDVDDDGRVTAVHHKPDEPTHRVVASEAFLYSTDALLRALDDLHDRLAGDAPDGDTGLGDFSEHLLPELVRTGTVVAYELPGYWRDLGRPSAYLQAHLDLLDDEVDVLDDPAWPIRTATPQGPAARIAAGAVVEESMLADGARVRGTVRHSVLGAGVLVEEGAVVHDSVLMAGAVVRAGAHVGWSIVDERARIGADAQVGRQRAPHGERLRSEQVTIVGMDALVHRDAVVERGTRVAPGAVVRAR